MRGSRSRHREARWLAARRARPCQAGDGCKTMTPALVAEHFLISARGKRAKNNNGGECAWEVGARAAGRFTLSSASWSRPVRRHFVGAQGAPGPAGPRLREQPGRQGPLRAHGVRGRSRTGTSQQPWKDPLLRLRLSEPGMKSGGSYQDFKVGSEQRLSTKPAGNCFPGVSRCSHLPKPASGRPRVPIQRLPRPPPAGGLSGVSWELPGAVQTPSSLSWPQAVCEIAPCSGPSCFRRP